MDEDQWRRSRIAHKLGFALICYHLLSSALSGDWFDGPCWGAKNPARTHAARWLTVRSKKSPTIAAIREFWHLWGFRSARARRCRPLIRAKFSEALCQGPLWLTEARRCQDHPSSIPKPCGKKQFLSSRVRCWPP